MKLNLNKKLNYNLRNIINKYINFTLKISYNAAVPKKKNEKSSQIETDSYLCICAALDRIDDLVQYCNSLNIEQTKEGIFELCNLLTHGQTLIDCITQIGKIFNVKYETKNGVSSFQNSGESGDGTDEEYFKYIRSLCSVHPLNTNLHGIYQGTNPEWCPYVGFLDRRNPLLFDKESNGANFYAKVYKYEDDDEKILSTHTKTIYLKTNEIFHYIEKRYNFLEQITLAAERYFKEKIDNLRNKHIKTPEEFDDYFDYLFELQKAVIERCGDGKDYVVREWIAIFKTKYEEEYLQNNLEAYQKAVKEEIKKIHKRLQGLVFEDDEINLEIFSYMPTPFEYHYQMEKIHYLYPSGYIEYDKENKLEFVETPINIECERLKSMLDILDNGIKKEENIEKLKDLAKKINRKYVTTNSEWARIQLKIMEPYLGKHFIFDYFTNDWKLYLQVQIALWLCGIENKI